MAESSARRAELRREKTYTWLILLLFVLAFLQVFKPVRKLSGAAFTDVYFTYRYEQPFGPGDQVKEQLERDLQEKLVDIDVPLARISFPTTTEIKLRVPLETKSEAEALGVRFEKLVEEVVPDRFGKLLESKADTSEFGDPPLATVAGFGLYRPALHLRRGLDLQGGVHLVLQARTQNVQLEFELGTSAAELKAALDVDAGGEVPPVEAGDEPPAEAEEPAAEEPPAEEPAGDEEPATDESEVTADEAELLADETLRDRVANRIARLVVDLSTNYGEQVGDVHGETVGSTIAIFRTQVDAGAADAAEQRATHARVILAELRKIFPAAAQKGEPQQLEIPANAVEQVKNVISRRVDGLGVAEAEVSTHGRDRVVVQLPGLRDPDEAVQMVGTTARLEFRKVPESYEPRVDEVDGRKVTSFVVAGTGEKVDTDIVYYEAPEFVTTDPQRADKNIMTGSDLKAGSIQVTFDGVQPAVSLMLGSDGSKRFDEFASENYQKFLAIYLDREVISAPVMNSTHFGGSVQISGGFRDVQEATQLKTLLDAGALPVPVDVVEQRSVSATLGADSVNQSLRAGMVGLALIILVMGGLYRVPGLLADVALMGYIMLVLAVLSMIGAALTLPGIMGLILSIGMAVDANVIIFERLKEELRETSTRPLPQCIRLSYERAATAIWDGNITTLLIAFVLMMFGTGPIKGFAVMLTIGICCSLFTALVVTRRFQNLFAASRLGANRRLYRG